MSRFSTPILALVAASLAVAAHPISAASFCDDKPGRYKNRNIFPTLKENLNIPFGRNTDPLLNDQVFNLAMDLFEPAGDTCAKRPLIIFMWGGNFQTGTRQNESGTCRNYARRGYICVTSDYRKSVEGVHSPYNSGTGAFMATQDTRAAIRFLRKNAETYRIDTSALYVGGCSSGAYAASWTGYLDKESEIPSVVEPRARDGGPEGNSGNPGYSSEFAGVLSLSGAVHDTAWIESGDVPYAGVGCKGDPLVNPDGGFSGSGMRYFGANAIAKRLGRFGIPSRTLIYPGNCHCPRPMDASGLDSTEDFLAKSAYEFMTLKANRTGTALRRRLTVVLDVREAAALAGSGEWTDVKGARIQKPEAVGAGRFRPAVYLAR